MSGNLTIDSDIILSGTPGINYIQFSDTTQQFTAYIPLIGEIKMYGGYGTPPTNYLWCNGNEVSRTVYSGLFAIIGTTYGSGDGSSTFNLPNLQQKFPIGPTNMTTGPMTINYTDSNGTPNTLTTGGNQTMNSNQLAQHTHNFSGTTTMNTQLSQVNSSTDANNTTVTTAPTGKRTVNVGGNYYGPDIGAMADNQFIHAGNNALSVNGTVGNNNYTNAQESLLPPFTVISFIIRYQ